MRQKRDRSAYWKAWYAANRDRRIAQQKSYRAENSDAINAAKREAGKRQTREQKERRNARSRANYIKHKEAILLRTRRYRQSRPEWRRAYARQMAVVYRPKINLYRKIKYATNPAFRLSLTTRNRLVQFIKAKGVLKTQSTLELLGVPSFEFLKIHLESQFKPGMTWDNYGLKGWHVDHIIPLAKFDLSVKEQLLNAFNYKNLQPLWALENIVKSDNTPRQEDTHVVTG